MYNSSLTQLLSEILTTATGIPTNEYAERYLFNRIGIETYFWNKAPEGYINGGGGLFLSPQDLARIALLYLAHGIWDEQQIVPADWVWQSSTSLIEVESNADYGLGYGYQWWIYRRKSSIGPRMYGGWGWGGQFPLIVPELGLIAVFTGWNIDDAASYPYTFNAFYEKLVRPVFDQNLKDAKFGHPSSLGIDRGK